MGSDQNQKFTSETNQIGVASPDLQHATCTENRDNNTESSQRNKG
jgi:hypothetical protein